MTTEGIPIPDALLASAEGALNALLALDAEGASRLQSIQGRVLLLELVGFGTRIYVVTGETGLLLFSTYDSEPDCVVRGTPGALLAMALSEHREDAVFEGSLQIDGDNGVAQTLGEVFKGLDIDWEEWLSKVLGDSVAHRLGMQARSAGQWAKRNSDMLTRNVREYLQEESHLLPADNEMRTFLDDVDRVRDDVERLEARVNRLAARLHKP
ncbi:MAG TPA: sterol-binding protein [Chromatiaceae bacterium]|nr:MAG: sterol-binding protein [Thiohalocapsa sp. PB-PSB1]HBG96438.1 sterol-binding protein [Chromatiaceae bacterium]HCS90547.1 sterol-binding protein [Chromatiaceae bacterium]